MSPSINAMKHCAGIIRTLQYEAATNAHVAENIQNNAVRALELRLASDDYLQVAQFLEEWIERLTIKPKE